MEIAKEDLSAFNFIGSLAVLPYINEDRNEVQVFCRQKIVSGWFELRFGCK